MTNAKSQQLTKQWSKEYFGCEFAYKAFSSERLKITDGRYHLSDHHIDINLLIYTEFDLHKLRQVVFHELCYHHLYLLRMGYHHRSREFRTLLAQVGGSRYTPPASRRKTNFKGKWYYICTGCSVKFARQWRSNTQRYICRRCGHKFILKN